jgi:hypothetical protein
MLYKNYGQNPNHAQKPDRQRVRDGRGRKDLRNIVRKEKNQTRFKKL